MADFKVREHGVGKRYIQLALTIRFGSASVHYCNNNKYLQSTACKVMVPIWFSRLQKMTMVQPCRERPHHSSSHHRILTESCCLFSPILQQKHIALYPWDQVKCLLYINLNGRPREEVGLGQGHFGEKSFHRYFRPTEAPSIPNQSSPQRSQLFPKVYILRSQ